MPEQDKGYLLVSTRTADGVLLVPNASVRVYDEDGDLIFEGKTKGDGYTSEIEVETPPLANSLVPNAPRPFSEVSIFVEREGFYDASFINVPVFPNVVTIQPTNLQAIPVGIPTSPYPDLVVDESGAEQL